MCDGGGKAGQGNGLKEDFSSFKTSFGELNLQAE